MGANPTSMCIFIYHDIAVLHASLNIFYYIIRRGRGSQAGGMFIPVAYAAESSYAARPTKRGQTGCVVAGIGCICTVVPRIVASSCYRQSADLSARCDKPERNNRDHTGLPLPSLYSHTLAVQYVYVHIHLPAFTPTAE